MAISCACPGCSTAFRVTDELAGKRVKCPKCLMVFTLPAAIPERAAAATEPPPGKKAAAPIKDLFREPEPRDSSRKASRRAVRDDDRDSNPDRDRDPPRSRRKARRSSGSALPWILGIVGAAVLMFVLCGGALAAIGFATFSGDNKVAVVKPIQPIVNPPGPFIPPNNPQPPGMPPPPVILLPGGEQQVNLKQGIGKRIQLVNGQFQTASQLTVQDPFDPDNKQFHCKLYQIDLQAGRTYQIDMTSPNPKVFDPILRLEDTNESVLAEDDDGGGYPNARIRYTPNFTGSFIVVATCYHPNQFGAFNLSIRDTSAGFK